MTDRLDDKQTRTLQASVEKAVWAILGQVHTAMPGVVESWSSTKQTISVQPSIKVSFDDGTSEALPILTNVPVMYPQGGGFQTTFPLVKGDRVMLHFSERSMDKLLNYGGTTVKPNDTKRFHITDAVAVAGFSTISSPLTIADVDSYVVTDGTMKFKAKGGNVSLTDGSLPFPAELVLALGKAELSGGGASLVGALLTFITSIVAIDPVVVPTVGPPPLFVAGFAWGPLVIAAMNTLATDLAKIKP